VPSVQIAAPIRDGHGRLTGFAEGSLDLNGIQDMAERITRGIPELKVAVLDQEGRVIAFPDADVRKAVANLSQLPLFSKVSGSDIEIRTGEDNHGTPVRATVAPLSDFGLGWTVVAYRPQAYQQSQAAVARNQVLAVAGLALLLGLVVAALLSEALARPIRRLARIATGVSHGDFSTKPALPHSLAPREIAALQMEIRYMVEELKDYTGDLENKIAERTAQVKKATHELESFMYSVTHDLKLPVVSLYSAAAMLEQKYGEGLDEQGRQYLRRLMSNAGFMEQLIADLLNFSRLGQHEYRMERLDVGQLVRETVEQCDSRMRAGGLAIEVRAPLPEVMFDHTALCKVFLNLIGNAMKFMGEQPHPKIEIGGYEDGEYVEYYVKDNGIGIAPQYHDQVFKLFQRLNETSVEGTGIGLASIKKIIETNGGRIWFRSTPGQGTTFFFRIPTRRGRSYQMSGNERVQTANGRRCG
jgi:signal transduction histidine kinase